MITGSKNNRMGMGKDALGFVQFQDLNWENETISTAKKTSACYSIQCHPGVSVDLEMSSCLKPNSAAGSHEFLSVKPKRPRNQQNAISYKCEKHSIDVVLLYTSGLFFAKGTPHLSA